MADALSACRVAFFDLDRTLIATNSAKGWMKRELNLGHISRRQGLRGAVWIGMYHLGFSRMEALIRDAAMTLKGSDEAVVRQRAEEFWAEEIAQSVRPGALEAISRHRAAGDLLVLLTGSSDHIAELAVSALGLDAALANVLESRGGTLSGRVREPICFGAGKLYYARMFAEDRGIALRDCLFYTDSFSDHPVLDQMGCPVVVNPDPRLERLARRRGWPVEDWGQPA